MRLREPFPLRNAYGSVMARWARQRIEERKRNDPHPGLFERHYRVAVEQQATYLETLSQTWAINPDEAPEDDYLLVARQALEEAAGRTRMDYKPSGRELMVWTDLVPAGGLSLPNPRTVLEALVTAASEEVCRNVSAGQAKVGNAENETTQLRAALYYVRQRAETAEAELEKAHERVATEARRAEVAEERADYWEAQAKDADDRAKTKPYATNGAEKATKPKTKTPRKKAAA
jgi:hypothetical protein